jgi:PASTA domain
MRVIALLALSLVAAGCGPTTAPPKRVPDVRSERLDLAEARLEARGLQWEEIGGGMFGVVVRSNWYVREQIPKPGTKATVVKLVVERCDWDD